MCSCIVKKYYITFRNLPLLWVICGTRRMCVCVVIGDEMPENRRCVTIEKRRYFEQSPSLTFNVFFILSVYGHWRTTITIYRYLQQLLLFL